MRDMLIDVLRDLNSLTPTDRALPSLMRQCVDANEMEAFSALLSLMPKKPAMEPANVDSLLKACIPVDAAECALLLLNHLEEIRCRREDQWLKTQPPWNVVPADVMDKINGSAEGRREVRDQFIRDRERFCQEFPKSRRLLTLARKAMNHSPEPAVRCARAFLLQAHRLRKESPCTGARLLNTDGEPLLDDEGKVGIPWPQFDNDLPQGLKRKRDVGIGGIDLSLGAESVPLQWINEVDDEYPPPIVFVRKCIAVDIRPDWKGKPAKPCDSGRWKLDGNKNFGPSGVDKCANATWKDSGKPGRCECNWACTRDQTCNPYCSNRSLQRGAGYRLQVFKHPVKGWCLRTLSHIKKGSFVMEYCAERLSEKKAGEREKDEPGIETYLMDMDKGMHFKLDAFAVRNHAAFAAFACSKKGANLEKKATWANNWDKEVPHVGYFATKDIEPGEELTYLRKDGVQPTRGEHRVCGCGLDGCTGRI